MLRSSIYTPIIAVGVLLIMFSSCSSKKNTFLTRTYHSVNTRYNIHFNADIAYQEALKSKEKSTVDNLSELVYIYPAADNDSLTATVPSSAPEGSGYGGESGNSSGGSFGTTIDKCTKAIKLHSIKAKPRRDPGKKKDEKYQAWLKQKEFNPFLKNTWLLLAKAEFGNGNYLRAISTFMYITKIYSTNKEIVDECKLWTARAYTQMGWMYEAANVLYKLDMEGPVSKKNEGLYASVRANYEVHSKEYDKAIPYLETAIKKEKSKHQKTRMNYLLGQLYNQAGQTDKAYKAFGKVQGLNTPYNYTFNAKLNQLELISATQKTDALKQLDKMTAAKKNAAYLDQIYTAMGNIYIHAGDTAMAIKNYALAIEKSTRSGFDKAQAQIKLGDIYFERRNYIPAQPCYSEALSKINKNNSHYAKVALRSAVLDELVVHVRNVAEQDSLQYLASLPEAERMDIIHKKIQQIKEEEAKQAKEEELQQKTEERNERISSWADLEKSTQEGNKVVSPPQAFIPQDNTIFYFYNTQTVAQGKVAFEKQWGKRKLEDDWRRRTKSISTFDQFANDEDTDTIPDIKKAPGKTDVAENTEGGENADIYSPEYYLQQLPLTPEKVEASNVIIEDALFNMGKIYKAKLGDLGLSVDAFETNLNRFPQTPNKEEIYYLLFLIYMQLNDRQQMAEYRNRIISDFPAGNYAIPLSQPDYEWNFRHIAIIQDSLYDTTYKAYLAGDVNTVRQNYQSLQARYPFVDLMPKFMLLDALTYAQTRDAKQLGTNLKALIDQYPKSDVEPLASDILSRIKDGQVLLSDGSPITGIDWTLAYDNDSTLFDENGAIAFTDSLDTQYMLLLRYKTGSIDRNDLLYNVADYNFSNYMIQTFDIDFDTQPNVETMQIKGFDTFANVRSYINKAMAEGGLLTKLDAGILVIPIATDNYSKLVVADGLNRYIDFFEEKLGYQLPALMAYWDGHREAIEKEENEEHLAQEELLKTTEDASVQEDTGKTAVIAPVQTDNPKKRTDVAENQNELDANDLLSDQQREMLGKANAATEAAEEFLNNPVDGLKNIFKKYKDRKNMTKEEKQALKEEEQAAKELKKQQQAKNKAIQDSLRKVERTRLEAERAKEKAVQDSLDVVDKQKQAEKERIRGEKKAAEDAKRQQLKQREQERENKENEQKERLRQREKERKEKENAQKEKRKAQEKERAEQLKLREQERKQKEQERKQRETKKK